MTGERTEPLHRPLSLMVVGAGNRGRIYAELALKRPHQARITAVAEPPTATDYGPVLALDDVIGTEGRARADRGAVRDVIEAHAATCHHTTTDLDTLGRRHARDEFCEDMQSPSFGAGTAAGRDARRTRRLAVVSQPRARDCSMRATAARGSSTSMTRRS